MKCTICSEAIDASMKEITRLYKTDSCFKVGSKVFQFARVETDELQNIKQSTTETIESELRSLSQMIRHSFSLRDLELQTLLRLELVRRREYTKRGLVLHCLRKHPGLNALLLKVV